MNKLIKEETKKFLVGVLVLTIAFGSITPTFAQTSIPMQNDNSTSISQRLSDNEMKEIVGGKKVKKLFEGSVKGYIKRILKETASVKIKAYASYPVTASYVWWDGKSSEAKYEVRFMPTGMSLTWITVDAEDASSKNLSHVVMFVFMWNNRKANIDIFLS